MSQLILALHYSYQSFISWNDTPIVTSVSLRSITEVPFPAVSICHDINTWKWPGIVNAMDSQGYEAKSYYLNEYDWMHHLTNRLKAIDLVLKKTNRYKEANNGTSLTLAKALLPIELHEVAELLHYITFAVKSSYKLYGFFKTLVDDYFKRQLQDLSLEEKAYQLKSQLCQGQTQYINATEYCMEWSSKIDTNEVMIIFFTVLHMFYVIYCFLDQVWAMDRGLLQGRRVLTIKVQIPECNHRHCAYT